MIDAPELLRRMQIALAEVADVERFQLRIEPSQDGYPIVSAWHSNPKEKALAWMARQLALGHDHPCYTCWLAAGGQSTVEPALSCRRGWCAHPEGPKYPPKELLYG